ncbi:hypothetical protein BJV78DRAFT_1327432 [Lactifluus subvellereus]|nr:hypothetical protein BJV78DRAFT_1327432 [Lactifluus subvellereus]
MHSASDPLSHEERKPTLWFLEERLVRYRIVEGDVWYSPQDDSVLVGLETLLMKGPSFQNGMLGCEDKEDAVVTGVGLGDIVTLRMESVSQYCSITRGADVDGIRIEKLRIEDKGPSLGMTRLEASRVLGAGGIFTYYPIRAGSFRALPVVGGAGIIGPYQLKISSLLFSSDIQSAVRISCLHYSTLQFKPTDLPNTRAGGVNTRVSAPYVIVDPSVDPSANSASTSSEVNKKHLQMRF